MNCLNCNIEFEPSRADAKTCSPKCRKELYNKRSIGTDKSQNGTDNVIMAERIIPEYFEFSIKHKPANENIDTSDIAKDKAKVRKAIYWYDVPLAALPIIKKDWPEMPDYMNGRQYFLWWKNEFKTNDDPSKGELEMPVIHNPLPIRENIKYEMGGEGSRRWGA